MCYGKTNYGKTKPAHKKLSLLSLLSLKTTLCLRILSCVCFKDNRDNLQFCPSWRDFYIIDNSVLVCFFTPLRMQVYKLRTLFVFPHISYAQLGGVAFTASIFVCITRSNLNLTTGTNALCVYIAHSYYWFDVFFHMIIIKDHPRKPHPRAASRLTPPRRRGE